MDVTLHTGDIEPPQWPAIEAALRRIDVGRARGQWPTPVDEIMIRGRLSGAGGAVVLDAALRRAREVIARVIKIGPAKLMHAEWTAFATHLEPRRTELIVGIEAATPGARNFEASAIGEYEAIVYNHVTQHTASSDLATLEEFIAGADGTVTDERATALIGALFTRARPVFYDAAEVVTAAEPLRGYNTTLGPDLVMEIDRAGARSASLGDAEFRPEQVRMPLQIIRAARSTEPPVWAAHGVSPDDMIAVHRLETTHPTDPTEPLTAERDGMTVELRVRAGSHDQRIDLAALVAGGPFTAFGRVVELRARRVRHRLERVLATAGDTDVDRAVGVLFDALGRVLEGSLPNRARSLVHGDLNAGNVLISGERPYLIDYARTRRDRPLLADFAWLEINLLRRAFGPGPTVDELLSLQRRLAVTALCFEATMVRDGDPGSIVERLDPPFRRLRRAYRVLARLRWEALRSYPAGATAFHREYQRHLLLAAHRTFKWPDAAQSEHAWRASVATGLAAAEWLGATPMAGWSDDEFEQVATAALALAVAPHQAVALVAPLAAETERRGRCTTRLTPALDRAAATVAAAFLEHQPPATRSPRSVPAPRNEPLVDLGGHLPGTDEHVPDVVEHLATQSTVLLVGSSGSGKSTVLGALGRRLLERRQRVSLIVQAADVARRVRPADTDTGAAADVLATELGDGAAVDLLTIGAVHLAIDGWSDIEAADRLKIEGWVTSLRRSYPRTAVVVAVRPADPADLPGFETVHLAEPQLDRAVTFLVEAAASAAVPVERAVRLVRTLLEAPDSEPVRDLVRTPLYLSMLARRLATTTVPSTPADLLVDHFSELPAPEFRCAVAAAVAAVDQVDATALIPPDLVGDWPELRARLVGRAVLREDHTFTFPVYRDFFAAQGLADGVVTVDQRIRSVRWQAPLRLLASLRSPGGVDASFDAFDLLDGLDPVAVARILTTSPSAHRHRDRLVEEATTTLRDGGAGALERARASQALAAIGRCGTDPLAGLTVDPQVPADSRVLCLSQLRDSPDGAAAIRHVLSEPDPPTAVRAAALRAATDMPGQTLVIAEALTNDTTWPTVDAAHHTLARGRVQLTRSHERAYLGAVERRIVEIEAELPRTTVVRTATALQDERVKLLARLPPQRRVTMLLARRFAHDIDDVVAGMLDDLCGGPVPTDGPGSTVFKALTGSAPADTDLTAGVDGCVATVGVHRLLAGPPGDVETLLSRLLSVPDPDARVLGAALRRLGTIPPADWPGGATAYADARASATGLAERLADRAILTGPREPVAAVVKAVSTVDPVHGQRLAVRLHQALQDAGDETRFCWPWFTTMSRCQSNVEDWPGLLGGPPADRDLAMTALASAGFHLDGGVPSPMPWVTGEVRRRVWAAHPRWGPTWATVEFLRAAATVRLWDVLPVAADLLRLPDTGTLIRPMPSGRAGVVETTARAEILTAVGYLARQYTEAHGPVPIVDEIHATVGQLPDGGHPSEATARLIALAYLGDWEALLSGLTPEPRLLAAARNAFRFWVPGPYTPPALRHQPAIEAWIVTRLATAGLASDVRSTLLEIEFDLATRSDLVPLVRAARGDRLPCQERDNPGPTAGT